MLQTINQVVGRVIRAKDDWGAVLLLGKRYKAIVDNPLFKYHEQLQVNNSGFKRFFQKHG
jgi:Rad3-related DNA helicase